MKLKIGFLAIFSMIFMFLAINMSWAIDPVPRSRTMMSYAFETGNSEGAPNQRGSVHYHNVNRQYEKAQRRAWSDGKLTDQERRWRHQERNRAGKGIKRDKGVDCRYNRGYRASTPKQPIFPRFSISISFPWIH